MTAQEAMVRVPADDPRQAGVMVIAVRNAVPILRWWGVCIGALLNLLLNLLALLNLPAARRLARTFHLAHA